MLSARLRSVHVDRVGAEHLEERAELAQFRQRRGHCAAGPDGPAGRCRSSTPTGPSAAGRDSKRRHRHAVLLSGTRHVVHGAGPVRHRDDAGWCSRGLRPCGCGWRCGWVTIGEAGAVVRIVLDRRCHHVQAELRSPARSLAMPPAPASRLAQPRAFGVAGHRAAPDRAAGGRSASRGTGPAPAGARRSPRCRRARCSRAQQVVAHEQAGLADDEQRRRSGTGRASARPRLRSSSRPAPTPKSAAPAPSRGTPRRCWRTARCTIDEPKKPSAACSLKVPAGPR